MPPIFGRLYPDALKVEQHKSTITMLFRPLWSDGQNIKKVTKEIEAPNSPRNRRIFFAVDPTIGCANSFVPFLSYVLLWLWPLDRDLTKSSVTCCETVETVYLWSMFDVLYDTCSRQRYV